MPNAEAVVPSVAGTTVLELKRSLEELCGVNAVAAALQKVPLQVREEFEPITLLAWVPVLTVSAVVDQIALEVNRDPEQLMDDAVRRATERTMRTMWRLALRLTSAEALITRTPILYARARNIGRLEARTVSPGVAELTLTGWPGATERSIRTLAVSVETILTLAGRRNVKVGWRLTEDGAAYRVTWRA
jgi:hypothetical protein